MAITNFSPHLPSQLKNGSFWVSLLFYITLLAFVIAIFSYGIFEVKSYFANKKITELNGKIATYGGEEEKLSEKKVFDYQKKLQDFQVLIGSHRISSQVFAFMEENTLPNVWFSSFAMSEVTNDLGLAGEASSIEALSKQIQVFEDSPSIRRVGALQSQTSEAGKVSFNFTISLNPTIFAFIPPEAAKEGTTDTSSAPITGLQSYVSPKGGYTMNVPKGWTINDSGKSNTIGFFLNPKEDKQANNVFAANIGVNSEATKGLDLNQYVSGLEKALPKTSSGYKVTGDEEITVGDIKGKFIEGTLTQDTLSLKNIRLVLIKNGTAYVLSATVLASSWDVYENVIMASLLSFKLN